MCAESRRCVRAERNAFRGTRCGAQPIAGEVGPAYVELGQLEPSVAVWGPHHRDVRPDSLEPNDAIHPAALDRCLAFQLESELNEERHGGRKIIDDDADMVHPL